MGQAQGMGGTTGQKKRITMGKDTKIQWCDHTVNWWGGCTKVSAGCANCYAETSTPARTFGIEWGAGKPRQKFKNAGLTLERLNYAAAVRQRANPDEPLPLVFWNSLSDWLDPEVPTEWQAGMLGAICRAPNLRHMLLTKRPERFWATIDVAWIEARANRDGELKDWLTAWKTGRPPTNVVLMVTAENQETALERVPQLMEWPAHTRALSLEPLLGPISLEALTWDVGALDQVIVGGESGVNARPCNTAWIWEIVAACRNHKIPCFVKQLGSNVHLGSRRIHMKDAKGGDPAEWPEQFRVRQPIRISKKP